MFAVVRAAIRAFAVGVVVGVLFAPRAGALTRKMLSERIAAAFDQLVELGGLPPVPPDRARTNGHTERAPAKRTRATGTDARTP
jgi:hypothetical protein